MLRYGLEMYFVVPVGTYGMFGNLKKAAMECRSRKKMRKRLPWKI